MAARRTTTTTLSQLFSWLEYQAWEGQLASFVKEGKSWRAHVNRQGIRVTATFDTKADARAWAIEQEAGILKGTIRGAGKRTLKDLLERYSKEVSPTKRGMRWEQLRIGRIIREDPELVSIKLNELAPPDLAKWREKRLSMVSPDSVIREMNLLSNVFSVAANEWHWIVKSPLKGLKRPKPSEPRDRLFVGDELDRITNATGYSPEQLPLSKMARVGAAVHFAIETGMRAGELCNLHWPDVHLRSSYSQLKRTKNGSARKVPLSTRAIEILSQLENVREHLKQNMVLMGAFADRSKADLLKQQLKALKIRFTIEDVAEDGRKSQKINAGPFKTKLLALAAHEKLKSAGIFGELAVVEAPVFGLNTQALDVLFRKARDRALIQDLHFHDTRHEAITRLAQKLTILDLARMVGIKDLKILMVYYNQTATEMAKRLA